jgi:NAD(P)H-hydrate epimerase
MSTPIISVAQMRDWENASWAAGKSQADVIRRVGQILAQKISELTRPGDLVALLAGKGHNGDDTRAVQNFLADRRVALLNVTAPDESLPQLSELLAQHPALVVDGIFGLGLNRPLDDAWKKFIAALNAARPQILAVDVPSGLSADSGEPLGDAVRATVTLTVGAAKRGLIAPQAGAFVGRLEVAADVGLLPCPVKNELNWNSPADFQNFPPWRSAASHKNTYGHLAVVAGSLGFHGAAVLATRGAQRAQPGLVTLYTMETVFHACAAQLQSAMVNVIKPQIVFPEKTSALLFGPGLASPTVPEDIKAVMRRVWLEARVPVVVDASALAWLPLYPLAKEVIRVITPHPGEAARLLKTTTAHVLANRPHALREISKHFCNCWVVLKGNQTLIGRSTGDIAINNSGNPHLAQGGSGDLLAGYLAGLLAQPALQKNPGQTIAYAVWQHGAAADKLSATRKNWTVEDLAVELGNA